MQIEPLAGRLHQGGCARGSSIGPNLTSRAPVTADCKRRWYHPNYAFRTGRFSKAARVRPPFREGHRGCPARVGLDRPGLLGGGPRRRYKPLVASARIWGRGTRRSGGGAWLESEKRCRR